MGETEKPRRGSGVMLSGARRSRLGIASGGEIFGETGEFQARIGQASQTCSRLACVVNQDIDRPLRFLDRCTRSFHRLIGIYVDRENLERQLLLSCNSSKFWRTIGSRIVAYTV